MNKTMIALMAALTASAGWAGDEVVASDGTMIAVDFRTGVRVVNSGEDIWPIAWSSQWGDGAATVTSAYDASVTAVPDAPSMPSGSPSRTLVDAQTGEEGVNFVSDGLGLYKLTHTSGGEEETAWFLLDSSVDTATLAYDGREFTPAKPRLVTTLDDVWDIAYSGKNWEPDASVATVTLKLNSRDGSVELLSETTGDGNYTLDSTAEGYATLTHTVDGNKTETAHLWFVSGQPTEEMAVIDTDDDNIADTEVLARGGASWLDTDGSGEGGSGSETGDSPLLITDIDSEETDSGLLWRVSFRPRLKGGAKNLEAWYRASQLNGMIRLRRAGTSEGLVEGAATVAEGEIKQPATEGGVPEEVILTKEAIDGNRVLWQIEVK